VEVGVEARDGRVGLELLPERDDDDERGDAADRRHTEPHQPGREKGADSVWKWFKVEPGVRQGSVLSPFLFTRKTHMLRRVEG
jgi:hypothetical protein